MTVQDKIALWQARWIKKPVAWAVRWAPLMRALFTATIRLQNSVPRGVTSERRALGSVPALCLTPRDSTGSGAVMCLHGGGFTIGSARSHAPMAGQMAAQLGRPVWVPDYARAPESPFPAAPQDCLAAYRALLATHAPQSIAITGDSAGGALCLALLHMIQSEGLPLPCAMVLMSPLGDLRPEGRAKLLSGPGDALLSKRWAMASALDYIGSASPSEPTLSPLAAPFSAAPPTLIQYAEDEALTPQILAISEALKATGAQVALRSFTPAYHSFQMDGTPIARKALAEAAAFLNRHMA